MHRIETSFAGHVLKIFSPCTQYLWDGVKATTGFKCTQNFLEFLILIEVKSREEGNKAKHGHNL